MHFKLKHFIYIFLVLLIFSGVVQAQDIMPLDQVKPGMEGRGKTVFKGFTVESFPVTIVDIIRGRGLEDDLILIRAGGEQIDRIGGIAAGMSGSPIFIEEKIIGAISYGWAFSDQHYALVTPIQSMLQLIKKDLTEKKNRSGKEKIKPENPADEDLKTLITEELKTPLYVSGLRGRALRRLEKGLKGYDIKLMPGSSPRDDLEDKAIEPGSAVAVQLVRGDINISSIGTVTYIKDNNLLAFGHPFLNKGQVDYLLSKAYINEVIPNLEQPFKLGSPTDKLIGTIRVDRGAGIAGKLDIFPRIIPLRIKINDLDLDQDNNVNVQLVRDEKLITPLSVNIALQSLDSTLDRIGKGTARVNYKLTGSGLPGLSIENNNIYYSRHDIAAMALVDFYQLLDVVTNNPFKKINLIDITLEVEVEDKDQVALVQEAKVLNEEIKPGDTLEVEVTLHPYRQDPFVKTVMLELPEEIEPGVASVIIDGGFTGQSYQLPSEEELGNDQEINQSIIEGYKSFEEILDDYMEQPKNNELIIQVLPAYPVAVPVSEEQEIKEDKPETSKEVEEEEKKEEEEKEEKEAEKSGEGKESKKEENINSEGNNGTGLQEPDSEPEIKKTITTEYVLEGSLTLDINIEQPEEESKESENKTPEDGQKI